MFQTFILKVVHYPQDLYPQSPNPKSAAHLQQAHLPWVTLTFSRSSNELGMHLL